MKDMVKDVGCVALCRSRSGLGRLTVRGDANSGPGRTFTWRQGTAEMGGGLSEPRGWYSTHPSLAAKAGVVRPASQQG